MDPKSLELFACKGFGHLAVLDLYSIQEGQYFTESSLSIFEVINPWRALWIYHPCLARSSDLVTSGRHFDADDGVERESRMFIVWKWRGFDALVEDHVTHRSLTLSGLSLFDNYVLGKIN